VDTVFHAAGYYPRFSLDGDAAVEQGTRQLRAVFDAAAQAGVKRVIYVSSTATVAAADGRAATEADVFARAPDYGVYHRLKWEMEAVALAETRVDVRVACPSACLGPWDLRVGTSALLVALAHGLDPQHPGGVVSWVDARDVAKGLVLLARAGDAPRRVIFSAGSTDLQALLERLATRYGVKSPRPPMSAEDARAYADAEERRAHTEGGRAALSREIVDLIVHGVPLDAALSRDALGLSYRPLDETLDAFDAWARRLRILPTPAVQETPHEPRA